MEILHQDDSAKGKFYITADGKEAARMSYVWAGQAQIIIDHTEVDESLKGTGAGKQLLESVVGWARAKGLKIIPLCPFAKALMMKNKEKYEDVLG